MTPSRSGRIAWMCPGVRPIIRLASMPTASGRPSRAFTATTDGSFSTTPRPRRYTRVLAVPRSIAMSRPTSAAYQGSDTEDLDFPSGSAGRRQAMRRPQSAPHAAHRCVSVGIRRRAGGAGQSAIREEDTDLAFGRVGPVAAVHKVLGELDGEISANGARSRFT